MQLDAQVVKGLHVPLPPEQFHVYPFLFVHGQQFFHGPADATTKQDIKYLNFNYLLA